MNVFIISVGIASQRLTKILHVVCYRSGNVACTAAVCLQEVAWKSCLVWQDVEDGGKMTFVSIVNKKSTEKYTSSTPTTSTNDWYRRYFHRDNRFRHLGEIYNRLRQNVKENLRKTCHSIFIQGNTYLHNISHNHVC